MRHRLAAPAIAAFVALAISLVGISGPSFWLDEAATISMARRSVPDLWLAVGNVDLVHGLYYLLVKPWMALFGPGELALRAPSALATAVAAAGVVALGRRCASASTGLAAGLVYACNVTVTRYAEEARPYALVTAAAVLASYLFVRAFQAPRRQWAWLAGYAFALALVGLLNLFALLLIVAHALTLLWARLAGLVEGRDVIRWCVPATVSVAALGAFIVKAQSEKEQVHRIPHPTAGEVWRFLGFMTGHGGRLLMAAFAVLAGIGAVAGARRTRRSGDGPEAAGPTLGLTMLTVPWLLAPPAILLTASLAVPMFRPRYAVFCLPALALLAGSGLVWLGRVRLPLLAAGAAALLVPAVPAQLKIRERDERIDDLRAGAAVLRRQARPGDAVVFLPSQGRWRAAAYADAYAGLRDAMLDRTPDQAGNLVGTDVDLDVLRQRLGQTHRVWIVGAKQPLEWQVKRLLVIERMGPYAISGEWRYKGGRLTLLTSVPTVRRVRTRVATGRGA